MSKLKNLAKKQKKNIYQKNQPRQQQQDQVKTDKFENQRRKKQDITIIEENVAELKFRPGGDQNHHQKDNSSIGATCQQNSSHITHGETRTDQTEGTIQERNQAEIQNNNLAADYDELKEAKVQNTSNAFPSSKAPDRQKESQTLSKSNTRYSNNLVQSSQAQMENQKDIADLPANLQSEPSLDIDIETPQLKNIQNTQIPKEQAAILKKTIKISSQVQSYKRASQQQNNQNKRKQKQIKSVPINEDYNNNAQKELVPQKKCSDKKFKINENILVPYSIRKKLSKSQQKANKISPKKKVASVTQFIDSNCYKVPFGKTRTLNEQSIAIIDQIYNTPNSQKSQKVTAHTVFLHSAPEKSVEKVLYKHSPQTKRTPMTVVDMMIEQMNQKQLSRQIYLQQKLLQSRNSSKRGDVSQVKMQPFQPNQIFKSISIDQEQQKQLQQLQQQQRIQDEKTASFLQQNEKKKVPKQALRRAQNSASSGKQSKNRQKAVNNKLPKKGNLVGSTQGNQGQQMRSSPKVFYRTSLDRQNQIQPRAHIKYDQSKTGRNYHQVSIENQKAHKTSNVRMPRFSPKETQSSRMGSQFDCNIEYYNLQKNQNPRSIQQHNFYRNNNKFYHRGDSNISQYASTPINQKQQGDTNRIEISNQNLISLQQQQQDSILALSDKNNKSSYRKHPSQTKLSQVKLSKIQRSSETRRKINARQNNEVRLAADCLLKKAQTVKIRQKGDNQIQILTTSGQKTYSPIKSSSILASKQMQKNLQNHFSSSIEKSSSRYPKHRPDVKEFSIARQLKSRLGTQLPQISHLKGHIINHKKMDKQQSKLDSKQQLSRDYIKALINSNLSNRETPIQYNLNSKRYNLPQNYLIEGIQNESSALSRSPHHPSTGVATKANIFNAKKKSHHRISAEPEVATTLWPYYEEKQKIFRQSTMASNHLQPVFDSNLQTQKQIYSGCFQQ